MVGVAYILVSANVSIPVICNALANVRLCAVIVVMEGVMIYALQIIKEEAIRSAT